MFEMRVGFIKRRNTAINDNGNVRMRRLQPINNAVVERWNGPVILGAEALQPCLARMDGECIHPCRHRGICKGEERLFGVLVVNPDPAFKGDGDRNCRFHGRDAVPNKCGLGHEASAETARLHPVRRAADIHVDFIIAEVFADLRGLSQKRRI